MAVKIARVFPRKTSYTPDDNCVFFDGPGMFPPEDITEAFVSVSFTWDIPKAERLASEWERVCRVTIGGPAYDDPGGEFVPGAFLRKGYVMTSRGCPNKCKWCLVPKREGKIRLLPIRDGIRVLDSNLLACPEQHIRDVFTMLHRQEGKVGLHGGFDIRFIKDWHIDLLAGLRKKLDRIYIAYDTPHVERLVLNAIKNIRSGAGLSLGQLRCFVLVGFENDTIDKAEQRCKFVLDNGAVPFASYYRGPYERDTKKPDEWQTLTARWAWMPGIFGRLKREGKSYVDPWKPRVRHTAC